MPKKKGYTPKKYKKEILKLIKREPFVSTNEVSKKLKIGYDTAFKYLKELSKNKKIKLKKVGNRRFWYE